MLFGFQQICSSIIGFSFLELSLQKTIMKKAASCRLQLHGTAVWVDHMTTVVKLFQVQCHVLAVVPAAAAIPYVTCVRDSPDQTLVGLLLHPALLLPFKKETREDMARLATAVAISIIRGSSHALKKWAI